MKPTQAEPLTDRQETFLPLSIIASPPPLMNDAARVRTTNLNDVGHTPILPRSSMSANVVPRMRLPEASVGGTACIGMF
jgi:hypothetical protein